MRSNERDSPILGRTRGRLPPLCELRAVKNDSLKAKNPSALVRGNIDIANAVLMTDEYKGYLGIKKFMEHRTVNHQVWCVTDDGTPEMLISLANTTLDSILYQESGFWKVVEGQRASEILEKYLQDHARNGLRRFPHWSAGATNARPPGPYCGLCCARWHGQLVGRQNMKGDASLHPANFSIAFGVWRRT